LRFPNHPKNYTLVVYVYKLINGKEKGTEWDHVIVIELKKGPTLG
jgi:hypothetical protein